LTAPRRALPSNVSDKGSDKGSRAPPRPLWRVAGFAAFKHHLSYLPRSGSVLTSLADDVADYETSNGSLRLPVDKPLPKQLVKKLVRARMREAGLA
jgi:hypothetical protein